MILPYIDYGDIFFMDANNNLVSKLQTLQNRALRICSNNRVNIPTDLLHLSAQTPKLVNRRETHLLNFMFRNKHNAKLLNVRNLRTRLHDAPVFLTVKPGCEKYKTNVFYKGATLWNSLPTHTRNIETYNVFKATQKKWALSRIYVLISSDVNFGHFLLLLSTFNIPS